MTMFVAYLSPPIAAKVWIGKIFPCPMSGCWLWIGAHDDDGYGRQGSELAHRYVYRRLFGAAPSGFDLDHLCRVRCCVNPAHLEPVTHRENVQRSRPPQTHCRAGHEFDYQNTYWRPDRPGQCGCRACNRASALRAREAA